METRAALLSWIVALLLHGALLFALPHARAAPFVRAVDVDILDAALALPVSPPAAALADPRREAALAQPSPAPAPVFPAHRPQDAADLTRRPALERRDEWACPWPADGDAEDIDLAAVLVAVTIDVTGHAVRVDVLADPGHGFGQAARRCAMQQRYLPGLDREGHAISTTTAPFRVRFVR